MSKIKKMFTSFRILFLIFVILVSIVAIHPTPSNEGVSIRSVVKESAANLAGIQSPKERSTPISKEKIISINNQAIKNEKEYYAFVSTLIPNQTITIRTDKQTYPLTVQSTINENGDVVAEDLGLRVYNAPKSNIRKGLDLQGGTRVLLEPETNLSAEDTASLIENMKQRLNIYGLSDLVIRDIVDREGFVGQEKHYILVEIAGASQEEVKDLLSKQGKFYASIGNKTVFVGGNDIVHVCRTPDCSGIDPQRCYPVEGGYTCGFRFSITLSTDAAQKQADVTSQLETVYDSNDEYLSQSLELYLDDSLMDSLKISSDLKGRAVTDIQISGAGNGLTQAEAVSDALKNMKNLQTVLITGSLPVKLNIIKIDTLSSTLGEEFSKNIINVGLLAILGVAIVIFLRYKKVAVALPMAFTMLAEIVIIVGFAALVGWNLDLAAIAGILVAAGTGVDDQIVIADETLKGENTVHANWAERVKNAFFIIMAAWAVTLASMLPLVFAGAGLLKGFALTTIIGVTIGVFITRPAFAAMSEILLNKENA